MKNFISKNKGAILLYIEIIIATFSLEHQALKGNTGERSFIFFEVSRIKLSIFQMTWALCSYDMPWSV